MQKLGFKAALIDIVTLTIGEIMLLMLRSLVVVTWSDKPT